MVSGHRDCSALVLNQDPPAALSQQQQLCDSPVCLSVCLSALLSGCREAQLRAGHRECGGSKAPGGVHSVGLAIRAE